MVKLLPHLLGVVSLSILLLFSIPSTSSAPQSTGESQQQQRSVTYPSNQQGYGGMSQPYNPQLPITLQIQPAPNPSLQSNPQFDPQQQQRFNQGQQGQMQQQQYRQQPYPPGGQYPQQPGQYPQQPGQYPQQPGQYQQGPPPPPYGAIPPINGGQQGQYPNVNINGRSQYDPNNRFYNGGTSTKIGYGTSIVCATIVMLTSLKMGFL